MDQSRAINALAPYIALAKSANSPRAAADLITQATSAANTYVFAELLQQPNVQALAGHEQYGPFFILLQYFAWDTWESYKTTPNLPPLSDAQALKLRLLSLLTFAAEKSAPSSTPSNLSYQSLCSRLDLKDPVDLEHIVTEAIYSGLVTGTLNPAAQTVVITSVAPLRDLAPGSVQSMMAELEAWSGRCDGVLAGLKMEIKNVLSNAQAQNKRDEAAAKQINAVQEGAEKSGAGAGGSLIGGGRSGHNTRGAQKRDQADDDDDYEDAMDVDTTSKGAGSKKGGILGKLTRGNK
ncbi:COP9 signalosome complex subunit 7a [Pseudocercospora fuligena]|uniref:COP9 signalosome complex subunit 7a n=1 Tax=Pseudocercospora fuligena TaxID=685502 RepID=A0A8H6R9M5_9PEZI|nr:COP9 signalosome complex subunit 7a [Pseudocercospora fuligena]